MRIFIALAIVSGVITVMAGNEVPSRVRFIVKDDANRAVIGASVDGCFLDDSASGARDRFGGTSDTNGTVCAEGRTWMGVYARFTANGYYTTTIRQNLRFERSQNGKGYVRPKRWDIDIPVLLKPVKTPVPMFYRRVANPYIGPFAGIGRYRLCCTSQYDLVTGDFLPPYGKGLTADIEFDWAMAIYTTNAIGRALQYDTNCDVRMARSADGIGEGTPDGADDGQYGSLCISDYTAPTDGYIKQFSFYRKVRDAKAETNDDHHYLYYFRIRTQTNEMGQVTNALYGKIYGQINGSFTYFLNPTPNDRNVEHDPKRNLFEMKHRMTGD